MICRMWHGRTPRSKDSETSIRAFAGDEPLTAKYYPEDKDYLLEFEELVQHYTVAAQVNNV